MVWKKKKEVFFNYEWWLNDPCVLLQFEWSMHIFDCFFMFFFETYSKVFHATGIIEIKLWNENCIRWWICTFLIKYIKLSVKTFTAKWMSKDSYKFNEWNSFFFVVAWIRNDMNDSVHLEWMHRMHVCMD